MKHIYILLYNNKYLNTFETFGKAVDERERLSRIGFLPRYFKIKYYEGDRY